MVNRIYIVTLIILFFLSVGRASVRADILMVVNSVMLDSVIKPDEWREVYRWVLADKNVPDRKEVLMLIRYHYGNFGKLTDLLCYLNEGRACKYLLQFVFPRIGSYTVHSKEFSIAGIRMPEKALPVVSAGSGELVPTAFPEKRKRLGPSHKVMVALKNNMIYDLALAPNVEVEFSIGKRWSLNTEYKCPWWLNSRNSFCYQLLSGGVEVRCWLGNRNLCNRLTGYFLGLYTEGGVYDFQLKEESGIRGKYYMTSGLSCGYARRITGHLAIECSLGIGYLTTEYCKYTSYKGELVRTNGGHFHFVGPTKVAVSLVWHITAGR